MKTENILRTCIDACMRYDADACSMPDALTFLTSNLTLASRRSDITTDMMHNISITQIEVCAIRDSLLTVSGGLKSMSYRCTLHSPRLSIGRSI